MHAHADVGAQPLEEQALPLAQSKVLTILVGKEADRPSECATGVQTTVGESMSFGSLSPVLVRSEPMLSEMHADPFQVVSAQEEMGAVYVRAAPSLKELHADLVQAEPAQEELDAGALSILDSGSGSLRLPLLFGQHSTKGAPGGGPLMLGSGSPSTELGPQHREAVDAAMG
jgi:hypothetical protein